MPSQDYEDGKSPEAVVVKDLDKFDMIFQAFEYEKGITNDCNFFLHSTIYAVNGPA